jgi:hypothetical protein
LAKPAVKAECDANLASINLGSYNETEAKGKLSEK